jgi:hypothetical protein
MASSLFATTAIVLSSAIATIVTTRDFKQFAPVVLGSKDYNLLWAKFILIFVSFVWAFMCHIQSIRYLNHVSCQAALPALFFSPYWLFEFWIPEYLPTPPSCLPETSEPDQLVGFPFLAC